MKGKKAVKFSIIVPIYNIEDYLPECIDSILLQDYDDYELLLIDDGSTDGSGEICDKYEKDKHVRIFHKKNGGLSSARNYGINKATGQYIMFIDGDDYLLNKNCLTMIDELIEKTRADVIQYKAVYFYDKTGKTKKQKELIGRRQGDIFMRLMELNRRGIFSISAWDKVIKRSIIEGNKLFFDESLLAEDIDWSLRLYPYVNSLELLNQDIYVYRQQREGSITSKKNERRIDSLWHIIEKWYRYAYKNEKMKSLYLNFLAYQYVILLTLVDRKNIDKYLGLKDLLKYDENYKVKLCNKIISLIGLKNGIFIFKLYSKMKDKGIIRI